MLYSFNPSMGRKSKRRKTTNPQNSKQNEEAEGRITSLPDALLLDILSLLPIKSAVSSGVLSRRWSTLWPQITSVTIDNHHFQDPSTFQSTVDHLISQLTSPFIRNFTLHLDTSVHLPPRVVDAWFRKICGRSVENIQVTVDVTSNRSLKLLLPPCVFHTQSLVQLQLLNFMHYEFPDDDVEFNLPNLKSLRLVLPPSQFRVVTKLIRACPLLEELVLAGNENWGEQGDDVVIDITSQSLENLFLCFIGSRETTKFVINAPNLGYFHINASAGSSCSLVAKPSALQIGRIWVSCQPLALSLLKLMLSVKNLFLDEVMVSALKSLKEDKVGEPLIFSNLEYLELALLLSPDSPSSVGELSWSHLDSLPAGLLTCVKVVHIKIRELTDENETHLLSLVTCLFSSAQVLKVLTFSIASDASGIDESRTAEPLREMDFCSELHNILLQSSSQCQINFSGKYVLVLRNRVKPVDVTKTDVCTTPVRRLATSMDTLFSF